MVSPPRSLSCLSASAPPPLKQLFPALKPFIPPQAEFTLRLEGEGWLFPALNSPPTPLQADFTMRLEGERQRLQSEHQQELARLVAQWAAEQEAAAAGVAVAMLGRHADAGRGER